MSYRNLNVDGESYRYVVGKTHIKVQKNGKEFGIWKKSEVGIPLLNSDEFIVTPRTVENLIQGRDTKYASFCDRHNFMCNGLAVDPYASEIYRKNILVDDCPKCLDESAWSI